MLLYQLVNLALSRLYVANLAKNLVFYSYSDTNLVVEYEPSRDGLTS
jgi:hypothetical protein